MLAVVHFDVSIGVNDLIYKSVVLETILRNVGMKLTCI